MIMPTEIEEDPRARVVWEEAVEASRDAYSRILDILRKAPMPTEYSTKEFLTGSLLVWEMKIKCRQKH